MCFSGKHSSDVWLFIDCSVMLLKFKRTVLRQSQRLLCLWKFGNNYAHTRPVTIYNSIFFPVFAVQKLLKSVKI